MSKNSTPPHVQKVRNMSSRKLTQECHDIWDLETREPERSLPKSFRDKKKS